MHACVYACVYVCGLGSSEAGRFAPTHSLWVLHVKGFESRCFRRAQAVGCNRFYSALSNVKLCRCSRMFYPLSMYAVFKFFLYPPFYHPPPHHHHQPHFANVDLSWLPSRSCWVR